MTRLGRALSSRMIIGTALSALMLISGCTFHSNQLEAVKRVLKPSQAVIQDHWFLSGPVGDRRVYPVQASDGIMFTDGEAIFLKFDGWHFVEIRGLAATHSGKKLENSVVTLFNYLETDSFNKGLEKENLSRQKSMFSGDSKRIVYEVRCGAWSLIPVVVGELLSQSCFFDNQRAFTNSIWLDQSGNIKALESVLGPGGGKVRVGMRDP